MPPKRARLVVDEREHPSVAAPAPLPTSRSHLVSGVVSVSPFPPVAAAEETPTMRRFAIPSAVLQRMPASASDRYESSPPLEGDGPAAEGLVAGEAVRGPVTMAEKRGREPGTSAPADDALEDELSELVARRRGDRRAAQLLPSPLSAPPRPRRPLILSSKWSLLRRSGGCVTDAGEAPCGRASDSDNGDETEGLPSCADRTDPTRSSHPRRGRGGGFGENFIRVGSAASASSDSSGWDSEEGADDLYADAADDLPVDTMDMSKVVPDEAVERRLRVRQRVHQLRERAREAKLHGQFRRHLAGYDADTLRADEELLLRSDDDSGSEHEEDEEESALGTESSDSEVSGEDTDEEEEVGGAASDATAGPPASRARNESGGGFGARARVRQGPQAVGASVDPTADGVVRLPESSPLAHRYRFGSIFYEVHVGSPAGPPSMYPCHHTLLALSGPITVQGPCGIIGFGLGEVAVGGFLLGRKQLVLWNRRERAVLMPMKKLRTKASERMELPDMRAERAAVAAKALHASVAEMAAGDRAVVPALDPAHARAQVSHVCDLLSPSDTTPGVSTTSPKSGANAEEEGWEEMGDVEAVFGTIDWDWVQATVKAWRAVFAHELPTVVLVVQPCEVGAGASVRRGGGPAAHAPMRRHYLQSANAKRRARRAQRGRGDSSPSRGPDAAGDPELGSADPHWIERASAEELARLQRRSGEPTAEQAQTAPTRGLSSGAFVEIPAFVAHRAEQNIDVALVSEVVPSIARQLGSGASGGCVMVVGAQDVGKSTLCRFLANVLLSQHGLCYWLDLDLGQPEFGVPGQFSLYCVRRPLLQRHDVSCAELVQSRFVGSATASSPQAVAAALASLCGVVSQHVARRHPVVVNTHGWVLSTGRRVTVEAIQRLRPKMLIHLVRPGEEAWAADSQALLDPAAGLNRQVVARRFLVRRPESAAAVGLLGQLPHAARAHGEGQGAGPVVVHTVRVHREAESLRLRVERRTQKGSAGRQSLWHSYLLPLVEHYVAAGEGGRRSGPPSTSASFPTALLRAPLRSLRAVVVAGTDEGAGRRVLPMAELAATLERRVVGVQIAYGTGAAGSTGPEVVSLDALPGGFPVTCYGFVESTEQEMVGAGRSGAGHVAIRVPVSPACVRQLLSTGEPRISLAVATGVAQDTDFMELFP